MRTFIEGTHQAKRWSDLKTIGFILMASSLLAGCGSGNTAHATKSTASTSSTTPGHGHGHGHGKKAHHPHKSHSTTPVVVAQVSSSGIGIAQGGRHRTLSSGVSIFAGPYPVAKNPWVVSGDTVKLLRQGKTITGLDIAPVWQGKITSIAGQSMVVTGTAGSLTVTQGLGLPRLGLKRLAVGTHVMLFGPSKTHVVGVAGTPTTHSLVVAAANWTKGTVTVQTSGGSTVTVPYEGPIHQLQHLGLGHHVRAYQAPDGQWIGAR